MGSRWDGIHADIFVDILQRLPPIPRRRLRLVCWHWRNVIDDRTPAPQFRAKVLAFVAGDGRRRAYVFRRAGDVVVVNPATGETLAVPPPSKTYQEFNDAAAYSFAYHPATGLYKIVHVPCRSGDGTLDVVRVFTLGDRSWREVPVPRGSSCLLSFGIISIDGATYRVARDAHSVMSFDLKDERVVFVKTLPVRVQLCLDHSWHLTTDAKGRLGLAVCSYDLKRTRRLKGSKTEGWMLEHEGVRIASSNH
ncbi:hypothetical protein BAE44_0020252 [Dichanthelium oligosanthes]|uniref:F-box domain-containing protein n=1 Tax=Dichanthelium oligosanthes TaxID=888268 RepID=A0A1E5V0R2_9POAL|nr:hypothetical protein BAE44_0020252 [Dichanthelium oligosanthes]